MACERRKKNKDPAANTKLDRVISLSVHDEAISGSILFSLPLSLSLIFDDFFSLALVVFFSSAMNRLGWFLTRSSGDLWPRKWAARTPSSIQIPRFSAD